MKIYLFQFFLFFLLQKANSSDILNAMKSILSVMDSYSATPSEKTKIESVINALENQQGTLTKNAETQNKNILVLSSLLDQLILKIQWFETFNKMIINKKIENIEIKYNDIKKAIFNITGSTQDTQLPELITILFLCIKKFYEKYFILLNQYELLLQEKTTKNKTIINSKLSNNNNDKTSKINQINTIFINENNKKENKDLSIQGKQENIIKNFLNYTTNITNKIKELLQIEKNKDISDDNNNKLYNFEPIQDTLKDALFYKINHIKKIIEEVNNVLNKIEILVNQTLSKVLVIENALKKNAYDPKYTTQNFIIETLAKSIIQSKKNRQYKKKIITNLKRQDTKFKLLINESKVFINKIDKKENRDNSFFNTDITLNKLYNIINLFQHYSLLLNSSLDNLHDLLETKQELANQKKILAKEIEPFKKNKEKPKKNSSSSKIHSKRGKKILIENNQEVV